MIGKIIQGNSIKNTVNYVAKESAFLLMANSDLEQIIQVAENYGSSRFKKESSHLILSFPNEDNDKLNPKKMQDISSEFMEKMGYDNNPYVAYFHTDTDKAHIHISTT